MYFCMTYFVDEEWLDGNSDMEICSTLTAEKKEMPKALEESGGLITQMLLQLLLLVVLGHLGVKKHSLSPLFVPVRLQIQRDL